MKTAATLLQHVSLYKTFRRYRCKKDIPKNAGFPILVDFGLWGQWWLVKAFGGLLCTDGREMPFHEMYAKNGERVIGRQDLMAAEGTKHAEAWRQSYGSAIDARLELSK